MKRSASEHSGAKPHPPGAEARPAGPGRTDRAVSADLREEIRLLRALVRRAATADRIDEVRRLVLALCTALRLQQALGDGANDELRRLLDEVLEQLDRERAGAGGGR